MAAIDIHMSSGQVAGKQVSLIICDEGTGPQLFIKVAGPVSREGFQKSVVFFGKETPEGPKLSNFTITTLPKKQI